ncbi:MAG: hypothetical protein ABEJ28_00395 [Salinigranum sp.]
MTKRTYITALALIVLVAPLGTMWDISQYRTSLEHPATAGNAVDAGSQVTPASSTPGAPSRAAAAPSPASTPAPAAKDAERSPPVSHSPTPVSPVEDPATGGSSSASASPTPSATATAAPDYDGDGIPDAVDRCPTRPETVNGFRDRDGCPDSVVTKTGAS